jgi:hypothetical protein
LKRTADQKDIEEQKVQEGEACLAKRDIIGGVTNLILGNCLPEAAVQSQGFLQSVYESPTIETVADFFTLTDIL